MVKRLLSSLAQPVNRCCITSHSIPSLARTAAASRQWPTYREWATRVMLLPEKDMFRNDFWSLSVKNLGSRSWCSVTHLVSQSLLFQWEWWSPWTALPLTSQRERHTAARSPGPPLQTDSVHMSVWRARLLQTHSSCIFSWCLCHFKYFQTIRGIISASPGSTSSCEWGTSALIGSWEKCCCVKVTLQSRTRTSQLQSNNAWVTVWLLAETHRDQLACLIKNFVINWASSAWTLICRVTVQVLSVSVWHLTRIFISDGWFQEAFSIFWVPWTYNLQSWTVTIPGDKWPHWCQSCQTSARVTANSKVTSWTHHAAKHCECCAATPADAPLGPLKTIGTDCSPADM